MGLDKTTLDSEIKKAFVKAKETEPPEDPEDSDKVQDQILTQLALDLSNAINDFVKSGDVVEVVVDVKDDSNNHIGTGTQTGTGKIQ
jgi:hypothetical protein